MDLKELTDQVVMVGPHLQLDPLMMQGHFGRISHLDDQQTKVYVRFQNRMLGLYATDDLLMLIPPLSMVDKLKDLDNTDDLSPYEFSQLLEMYVLHMTGDLAMQKKALNMAFSSTSLYYAAVFSVSDWLDLYNGQDKGLQYPGRSR